MTLSAPAPAGLLVCLLDGVSPGQSRTLSRVAKWSSSPSISAISPAPRRVRWAISTLLERKPHAVNVTSADSSRTGLTVMTATELQVTRSC